MHWKLACEIGNLMHSEVSENSSCMSSRKARKRKFPFNRGVYQHLSNKLPNGSALFPKQKKKMEGKDKKGKIVLNLQMTSHLSWNDLVPAFVNKMHQHMKHVEQKFPKQTHKRDRERDSLLWNLALLLCLCLPEMSKQSAALGLPIPGASMPTSLQKFQASKATLRPSLLIPGSPTADSSRATAATGPRSNITLPTKSVMFQLECLFMAKKVTTGLWS